MLLARIPLVLVITCVALVAGCGGHVASTSTKRIVRQDLTDQTSSQTQYWLYLYDTTGRTTQSVGYDGAGNVESITTLSYVGNLRQTSSLADASGNVMSVTDYTYESGVLSAAAQRTSTGEVAEKREYVFEAGRKSTTFVYVADGSLTTRTEFDYDPVSFQRLGAHVYDGTGAAIVSSVRVYEQGLFVESHTDRPTAAACLKFQYEDGPLAVNADDYFEF